MAHIGDEASGRYYVHAWRNQKMGHRHGAPEPRPYDLLHLFSSHVEKRGTPYVCMWPFAHKQECHTCLGFYSTSNIKYDMRYLNFFSLAIKRYVVM